MTSFPTSHERIDALTGLRFVAAAVVLLEHFPQIVPGLGVDAAMQGGAGVSLFFVLSGFVLTHRYGSSPSESRGELRRYFVARIARIVPLHLIAMALVVPLVFAVNDPFSGRSVAVVLAGLVANVVLVHAWFPALEAHLWNGPSWSISVEAFFYALFPLLVPVVVRPLFVRRRLGRAIVGVVVLQVVAVVVLSLLAAEVLLRRSGDLEGTRLILGRLQQVPALRLGEFVAGCLLGAAYRPEHRRADIPGWRVLERRSVRSGLLAAVVIAAAAIQFTPTCLAAACGRDATSNLGLVNLRIFVVYVPLAVVTVAAVAWGSSWATGVLRSRPFLVLGDASYAIYLLQWSAWIVLNRDGRVPSATEAGAAIVVVIVAALVTHRWLEVPLRRRVTSRWA